MTDTLPGYDAYKLASPPEPPLAERQRNDRRADAEHSP